MLLPLMIMMIMVVVVVVMVVFAGGVASNGFRRRIRCDPVGGDERRQSGRRFRVVGGLLRFFRRIDGDGRSRRRRRWRWRRQQWQRRRRRRRPSVGQQVYRPHAVEQQLPLLLTSTVSVKTSKIRVINVKLRLTQFIPRAKPTNPPWTTVSSGT